MSNSYVTLLHDKYLFKFNIVTLNGNCSEYGIYQLHQLDEN